MGKNLLTVKDLTVNVEEKEILHGVNLTIGKGETHVLLGPNGTGKSTLGNTLLGNPKYNVTRGEIWFQGKNITEEPVNERAKMGLFLSFQNPLEVPGVTLSSFIRSAVELKTGKRMRLFEFRKEMEKSKKYQPDHSRHCRTDRKDQGDFGFGSRESNNRKCQKTFWNPGLY